VVQFVELQEMISRYLEPDLKLGLKYEVQNVMDSSHITKCSGGGEWGGWFSSVALSTPPRASSVIGMDSRADDNVDSLAG
jgi:hypothetical protein